jgi:hypothetical protein
MGRVKGTSIEARDRVRQPALTLSDAAKCVIHIQKKKSCPPDDSGDARIPSESDHDSERHHIVYDHFPAFYYTGLNVTLF